LEEVEGSAVSQIQGSPRASRILIVEDNPSTRLLFRVALEGAGHAVLEAPDGAMAIELMARQSPDLVLQDLVLPDMDGFELVEIGRANV